MSAQLQTARLYKLRQVLTHQDMKQTVSSALGTLHCQWFAIVHCIKLQELCVIFSEVFCLKGLCLLYFHRVKEVFTSS